MSVVVTLPVSLEVEELLANLNKLSSPVPQPLSFDAKLKCLIKSMRVIRYYHRSVGIFKYVIM